MATIHRNLSEYNLNQMPDASQMRFGIVVSEWNAQVTEALKKGALDTLTTHQAQQVDVVYVPGSYELIYGSKALAKSAPYDAVIAIGCVIQGETRHFDFVCEAVAQGIKDVNLMQDTPVIFCVLTDNHLDQSLARSGGIHGNKGVEAAVAAIRMAALRKQLGR
jgi:6,7-dimethyl-8-ribityllumazine synthase